jgi:hypothetical protein
VSALLADQSLISQCDVESDVCGARGILPQPLADRLLAASIERTAIVGEGLSEPGSRNPDRGASADAIGPAVYRASLGSL